MIFSREKWNSIFRNNRYFKCGRGLSRNPRGDFWHQNLDIFGTLNILIILGLGRLASDFGGNVGVALNDPMVMNRVHFTIIDNEQQERTTLTAIAGNEVCARVHHTNARINLYRRWKGLLRDPDALRDYIEAMDTAGDNQEPIWNRVLNMDHVEHLVGAQHHESVCKAICRQRRYPAPAFSRPNSRGCYHCGAIAHTARDCPNGGYMYKDSTGKPVPRSAASEPKCFCCSRRYKVVTLTLVGKTRRTIQIYHSSENCPFRHPKSFGAVNQRCKGCKKELQFCWNCALASCITNGYRRTPTCQGHRLKDCPEPRYMPKLNDMVKGVGASRDLLVREHYREMHTGLLPREYRDLCELFPKEMRANGKHGINAQTICQGSKTLARSEHTEPLQCAICTEHRKNSRFVFLPCCSREGGTNFLHADCLTKWAEQSRHLKCFSASAGIVPCPFCRKDLQMDSLTKYLPQLDVGEDEAILMQGGSSGLLQISQQSVMLLQQKENWDPTQPCTSLQAAARSRGIIQSNANVASKLNNEGEDDITSKEDFC